MSIIENYINNHVNVEKPKKKRKRWTQQDYINELSIINPNLEVIGIYTRKKDKILHRCKIHNVVWELSPDNALKGVGCKICGNEKISIKNSKTHEEYIDELSIKNPTIVLTGEYKGASTPTSHNCLVCGYNWNPTPANLLYGTGCPNCAGNIRRTHDEYVNLLSLLSPNILVLEEYINSCTPIKHLCLKHDYMWMVVPSSIINGTECYYCGLEKLSNSLRFTQKQYEDKLKDVTDEIICLEKYQDILTPILHKCLKCNYEWNATPNNLLRNHGCPKCNKSIGENVIMRWLDMNKINYIYQMPFDDCRDKYPLPFDFYIPNVNKAIEFDGKQHFEPVEYFGGQEAFEIRQHHDQIKTQYCEDNNIPLLRIPYYADIETELNNFLFN